MKRGKLLLACLANFLAKTCQIGKDLEDLNLCEWTGWCTHFATSLNLSKGLDIQLLKYVGANVAGQLIFLPSGGRQWVDRVRRDIMNFSGMTPFAKNAQRRTIRVTHPSGCKGEEC